MSREKRHKKNHHVDATNENKNDPSKSSLFTEADAKSVEASGYTLGRGAPQTNRLMQEHTIPTGVVDIDESVQLPTSPSKSYPVLQSSENYYRNHGYLPPISRHPYYNNQHYPYGYYHPAPDYYHGYLSPPYPMYYEYDPSYDYYHRHRKPMKEVETYDPRWWYMPLNSVHAPKKWRPPEYHYKPPKWYESTSKRSMMSTNLPSLYSSHRKYVDCRCEVCKPSREPSRGAKWYVNE